MPQVVPVEGNANRPSDTFPKKTLAVGTLRTDVRITERNKVTEQRGPRREEEDLVVALVVLPESSHPRLLQGKFPPHKGTATIFPTTQDIAVREVAMNQ